MSSENNAVSFSDLELNQSILKSLEEIGYESPSPIQAATIPFLLEGKDVLGQAQTGTGKTAAFALPILSSIDLKKKDPQVLVLAPTRELAIQVAEAFQKYATYMKGFHVLPIYGGQEYGGQIRALKRGVHVVVGTPGRVMDHMRKGTLNLDGLTTLVLDEADEMLRMGFIDDVEWILEQTPDERQIALFSATMPSVIRRIAQTHLNNPEEVTIKVKTTTADTITQRYWMVGEHHKLDILTRLLEVEPFDGMIIFVRTKTATVELAEKLEARGYSAAALNGDIPQKQREKTVDQLKKGKFDILIATDVVARGLDVERISHVINYDIPYDTEAYVHRIGRTGRAGRKGDAILFVTPRETRLLRAIERTTKKSIDLLELPSTETINDKRIAKFTQRISDTLASEERDLELFQRLLEDYQQEHNIPAIEIAAALAKLLQGDEPLLMKEPPKGKPAREGRTQRERAPRSDKSDRPRRESRPDEDKERFRIEVGNVHGVRPGNIVGAIANEAGIDSEYIGRIQIHDDYSTVDLPQGMPNEVFNSLKKVWVAGQQLQISRVAGGGDKPPSRFKGKRKPKSGGKTATKKSSTKGRIKKR